MYVGAQHEKRRARGYRLLDHNAVHVPIRAVTYISIGPTFFGFSRVSSAREQGVANNIDRRRSVRRPHCVSRGARRCGPSDCAAAASLLVPRTYKSRRHLTLDVRWPTCNKYPACPTRHRSVSTHGRSPRAGHHSRAPRHLRSRRGPSDHGLRPTRGRGIRDGPARRRCRRRSRRDPRSRRSPLLRSRP
jgi:hypothetical protein